MLTYVRLTEPLRVVTLKLECLQTLYDLDNSPNLVRLVELHVDVLLRVRAVLFKRFDQLCFALWDNVSIMIAWDLKVDSDGRVRYCSERCPGVHTASAQAQS